MKSIINITNGTYLNSYLQKKYSNETFIPFNEAMIEGNPILPIFSDTFIDERCHTHQVSNESYLENMKGFLNFSKDIQSYDSIVLWFGTIVAGVCGALWFLTQYEFESYVQDGSGYNSIHTGDGDAINGAEILQGTEEEWKS